MTRDENPGYAPEVQALIEERDLLREELKKAAELVTMVEQQAQIARHLGRIADAVEQQLASRDVVMTRIIPPGGIPR